MLLGIDAPPVRRRAQLSKAQMIGTPLSAEQAASWLAQRMYASGTSVLVRDGVMVDAVPPYDPCLAATAVYYEIPWCDVVWVEPMLDEPGPQGAIRFGCWREVDDGDEVAGPHGRKLLGPPVTLALTGHGHEGRAVAMPSSAPNG